MSLSWKSIKLGVIATMDKIQIVDIMIDEIMESIPDDLWYNKPSHYDEQIEEEYEEENLLVLSNW